MTWLILLWTWLYLCSSYWMIWLSIFFTFALKWQRPTRLITVHRASSLDIDRLIDITLGLLLGLRSSVWTLCRLTSRGAHMLFNLKALTIVGCRCFKLSCEWHWWSTLNTLNPFAFPVLRLMQLSSYGMWNRERSFSVSPITRGSSSPSKVVFHV